MKDAGNSFGTCAGSAAWPTRGAAALLDRLAALIAIAGIVLRLLSAGATGTGTNLLIDQFAWAALSAWFASRALTPGACWRLAGPEFGLLAFSIACLASVLRASCMPAAMDQAMAFLTCALLYNFAVNALGRETILGIFSSTTFSLCVYAAIQYCFIFPETQAAFPRLPVDLSRRLEAREVHATFFYPNTFGGYLALVLPLLVGMTLDARRSGRRSILPPAAAAAAAALGMAMTGSAGAWAALGVGAAAFAALWATRRRGRRWAIAGGLAAAIICSAALALALPGLAARSQSLRNRQAYWTAAIRIFRTAPVLGVGLNNYQDFYPEHKPDVPQETRKAHNDYLQLLAETGLLGLAAFLSFILLGMRPALSAAPEGIGTGNRTEPPAGHAAAAASAGVVLAVLVGDRITVGPALAAGAAWLAHFLLWRPPAGETPFTRIGLAAGIVAMLAHMAVDFDLEDRGAAAALFLALALASVMGGGWMTLRLPRAAGAAAAGTLALISLSLASLAIPRALAAEWAIKGASAALDRFEVEIIGGKLGTSLDDALRLAEKAQGENPFATEGYLLHARIHFHWWNLLRRTSPEGSDRLAELQEKEQITLLALDKALRIRPRDVGAVRAKVDCHREFRRFYLDAAARRPSDADRFLAQADFHLEEAVAHQRRALALYPTLAANHYVMARLLDLRDGGQEALEHYGRALELHGTAAAERWSTGRLELPPLPLARTLNRLGRPFDAAEAIAAHARRVIEGCDAPEARARLERLRAAPEAFGGAPDEADDLMGPVIADAVNGILRGLDK